jgi:hypothetical protein
MGKLSRRKFLQGAAAVGTTLALGRWSSRLAQGTAWASTRAAIPTHRVVHAHSDAATYWDYATGWYGDYVSQAIVDEMTDQGVMALTNTVTPADAWRALIPIYTAGQKVAIKINLNNADCSDSDQVIDALPQPINAVIRGLKAIGVAENDIWVYDVTNGWHSGEMPARLVNVVTALYPNVQFHSNAGSCSIALGYSSSERIHFNVPAGKPAISDRPICDALADAST